jgi:hypothetical protein
MDDLERSIFRRRLVMIDDGLRVSRGKLARQTLYVGNQSFDLRQRSGFYDMAHGDD